MNFSTKIKKFYEGMRVYDCLLEDEKAIHLPFALSFTVTITTILDQLRMFLSDLANNVCREIPDIDYDIMTDALKIMSKKLKVDMEALGNMTIRQLLEELFGAHLDKTPSEMHNFIFDSVRQMAEMIKQIHKGVKNADPALFEDYFINHIRDHNWTDVERIYKKWKRKFTKVTMEMLDHSMRLREANEIIAELRKGNERNEAGAIRFADEKGNVKLVVGAERVISIESAGNYVTILYDNDGKLVRYSLRNTLKSIEEICKANGLVRCHRSYFVNLNKIKIIRRNSEGIFAEIDHSGVDDIPISKTYAPELMRLFSE